MCKSSLLLAVVAISIVVAGCGGGAPNPSPFAGHWTGTWSDSGNSQTGDLQGTVAFDGAMAGTIRNDTLVTNGTFAGTISKDGTVHITYIYPGSTYTGKGKWTSPQAGRLMGNLGTFDGAMQIGTSAFDLTRD